MSTESILELKNVFVSLKDSEGRNKGATKAKEIIKGISLKAKQGEIHAIMGPNGSGKSTLANAIMGHPNYALTAGDILIDGRSIKSKPADERAKLGMFLAFQHPVELSGISMFELVKTAARQQPKHGKSDISKSVNAEMKKLKMNPDFLGRYANEGFSGGEKKKSEIFQLTMLKPKFALLDEIDSGLDIDSLKLVAKRITGLSEKTGIIVITHYNRLLKYLRPDFVHVMIDGRIVKSGSSALAAKLEKTGYEYFNKKKEKKAEK